MLIMFARIGEREAGETALTVTKHLATEFETLVHKRQAALQALTAAVQAAQAPHHPDACANP